MENIDRDTKRGKKALDPPPPPPPFVFAYSGPCSGPSHASLFY